MPKYKPGDSVAYTFGDRPVMFMILDMDLEAQKIYVKDYAYEPTYCVIGIKGEFDGEILLLPVGMVDGCFTKI